MQKLIPLISLDAKFGEDILNHSWGITIGLDWAEFNVSTNTV